MPQLLEALQIRFIYSQQEQPQAQSSPEHSVPQVQSVAQLCSVQQFSLDAQQEAFLLLLTAYNIPLVAMMANDANKMIFFMINVFKFFCL